MAPRRTFLNLVLFGQPDHWHDRRTALGGSAADTFARYVQYVQQAERAKLDAYFKADFLGFDAARVEGDPSLRNEPLTIVAALAPLTERIGLVVTQSTTFFEPYNVARQIATLHNLSGGRAGWNAVTSFNGETNFGPTQFSTLPDRYERAHEFVDVVLKLWNGWDEDALDLRAGEKPTLDPAKVRTTDHVGRFYSVEQPLDVSRLVGDQPVVFQAGASEDGIAFAARFGEAVFVATPDLKRAHEYYDRLKSLVVQNGRHRDSLRVLPGMRTYVADSEREAQAVYREMFEQEGYYASRREFVKREAPLLDLDGLDLDDVISPERIAPVEEFAANTQRRVSRGLLLRDLLTELDGVTVRQFLQRLHGHGHLDVVGTAEQVADTLAEWFTVRAADGFTVHGGNSFDRFTDEVVPALVDRGVFRSEYEGTTLRENLGL